MTERRPSLITIGYEGRNQNDVVTLLLDAGVEELIDVRWRPLSRKRGLSKSALSDALDSAGISYHHDRRLGTPPELMHQLRTGGAYDWDAYADHLDGQHEAVLDAVALADRRRTALLCFEANPQECHRLLVGQAVTNLGTLGLLHL